MSERMKTFIVSGIAGWLALALIGCGSDGGDRGAETPDLGEPPADVPEMEAPGVDSVPDTVEGTPSDVPLTPTTDTVVPDSASTTTPPAIKTLDWRPCGQFDDRDIECAELGVPIDYAQPSGDTVTLALRRIVANPLEPYRGSMLFNPGGPGGSGIDAALSLFEDGIFDAIAPGFDIVGFDPRGVAASGSRGCGVSAPDPYASDSLQAPDSIQQYVDALRAEGEQCERAWGPLFRHMGSNNVVRDMDEIRKALDEPVLNYYGASYGTLLGALYAHAYPETTGRMVLDAPVNPRLGDAQMSAEQLEGAFAVQEALFSECEQGNAACPPNARQLFEQADAAAATAGAEGSFLYTWMLLLAFSGAKDFLLETLAQAGADPSGAWLQSFFAATAASVQNTGLGSDVPLLAVNCTDNVTEPPTLAQIESLGAQLEEENPFLGPFYARFGAACLGWPVTRDPIPLPTASEAPAILVIGGTKDSRTPYPWASVMTETLGNATLLTSEHWGHGAVANGSNCAVFYVRAYFTSGSLPSAGTVCPDPNPPVPAPAPEPAPAQ
jgi:pimeloyl-ACP methyl ester carboxylesterase